MLTKRIIPCLDISQKRVVKGKKFLGLVDAGDPIQLAAYYYNEGADELALLDITATVQNREIILDIINKVAKRIFIPFTVGGGIRTIADVQKCLRAGADKVSINSEAVKNPSLISKAANIYGSQCIVIAIDVKKNNGDWEVYIQGGNKATGIKILPWAKELVKKGAGELLVTSIDRDGTKYGYDVELIKLISTQVNVPIIASGGAGTSEDFIDVFRLGYADAALAASLFHYGELRIKDVKQYLEKNNIPVRNVI